MRAVMCVDVECDLREAEHPGPARWDGADAMFHDHTWLRSAMVGGDGDGGACINWFVRIDPQVETCHGSPTWAAEHYGEQLERLRSAGDGIGVHPHNFRWCDPIGRWVNDGTDAWVERVVADALDGFAATFGRPCTTYRHGDRYISQTIVRLLLADPHVAVDLTLEPGTPTVRGLVPTEANIGVSCHVDAALTQCFQPSDDDLQIPAPPDGRLTMVPLTTAAEPGSPHLVNLQLWRDPEEFDRLLQLRLLDPDLDHLAFAMRTDVALVREWREAMAHNLRRLREVVPDLTWMNAATMALPVGAPPPTGPGVTGGLAATVTNLRRDRELLRIDLMLASADQRRTAAALAEARSRACELNDELAASTAALAEADAVQAELAADVQAMQSTITWRIRQRLLPILRPLNSALRRVARLARW